MNQRAVSAPNLSMISSGSTVLRFDFDIFSIGPISIAASPSSAKARLPSGAASMRTSAGETQRPAASR
jgi:hypothetical protein